MSATHSYPMQDLALSAGQAAAAVFERFVLIEAKSSVRRCDVHALCLSGFLVKDIVERLELGQDPLQ